MSTTKLPEAFERKYSDDAPVQHDNSHSYVWADGYNSALEATGAKELWEAARDVIAEQSIAHSPNCFSLPGSFRYDQNRCNGCAMSRLRAALAKSNPNQHK